MVKEKQRFLNAPVNYAIEKSRLMTMKSDAEAQGNLARAKEIQHEIDELDAKANDIEHTRNVKLSAVALINQKRRIEMKQNFLDPKKVSHDPTPQDDPFTRKSNRTRMVTGAPKKKPAPPNKAPSTSQASDRVGDSPESENGAENPSAAAWVIPPSLTSLVRPAQGLAISKQSAKHCSIELDIDI